VFDPLAGAERLENGALFYKVDQKEIAIPDEEKLHAEYERLKAYNSGALEVAEDDANELRMALLDDMENNSQFNVDEFNDVLD